MDVRNIAIQCFKDEAEAVLGLIPQLDDDFDKAVELMLHCKGKIVVTGVGKAVMWERRLQPPCRVQVPLRFSSIPSMCSMATLV